MNAIWDNGGEYSGHSIYFVEIGEGAEADRRAGLLQRGTDDDGKLVATVKSIYWLGEVPLSWGEFVDGNEYSLHEEGCRGRFSEEPCSCWVGFELAKVRP